MSTDVMDRLRRTNPHDANDVPTLTPEREALLIVAAKSEFSGPLRRSWLVAAATGLVLGIGVIAIWFSGGSNSLLTTDENAVTSDEPIVTTETASATVTVPAIPAPIKQITPIDITCSTGFNNSSLACPNLIDGTTAYWNDLSLRGEGAVISITFAGRSNSNRFNSSTSTMMPGSAATTESAVSRSSPTTCLTSLSSMRSPTTTTAPTR